MTIIANDMQPVPRTAPQKIARIRPEQGLFDLELDVVWRYRDLLAVMILRDIQVLYKQAALGAGWAIVQPLFAVAIFTIVFGWFARMPSDGVPYPVFAFAAVLPWTYFAEATRRASIGLVDDSDLIRKVYFPRLILPLAKATAPLVDFAISSLVLLALMLAYGLTPQLTFLLIYPLALLAGLLALSVSLWLGPINVRFRDIKHTLPFIIQVWMYASPIVYPLSQVPAEAKVFYSLNPMVGVIEGFRWAILGAGNPDVAALCISLGVMALLLVSGLVFFKKQERIFADVI